MSGRARDRMGAEARPGRGGGRLSGRRGLPAGRPTLLLAALVVLPSLALSPPEAAAQELDEAVAALDGGTLRFAFPVRPGVRICEEGIRMGEERRVSWGRAGWEGREEVCGPGPLRVEVAVEGGRVVGVEPLRRAESGAERARELGEVPAEEAARFLASVARGSRAEPGAAEDAVLPLVLADVERGWETLLELARDGRAPSEARSASLFWLGQEAAEAVTAGLVEVADRADEAQEIRDAAVFALSRRPRGEGVPALMELARTSPRAGTRRSALFWLAQSPGPEVVDFFAEILRQGDGGGGGAR